jgi:hypothetical protein
VAQEYPGLHVSKGDVPSEVDLDRIAWNLPPAPGPPRVHPQKPTHTSTVGRTRQERDRERHQARLDDIGEQVSSGALVIRQMSHAERATWAERRAELEASLTPAERTRRDVALRNRRTRAELLS